MKKKKKMVEDLQGQQATTNQSVNTESLKEKLRYLRNQNFIIKTITENQPLSSPSSTQSYQIRENNITFL